MKTTLYHRRASGAIKVWSCWVTGPWLHSEWGQQDGKMTSTKDRHGTTFLALEKLEKKVKSRLKKGYVFNLHKVAGSIQVDDTRMNFDRLPKSFAPAKPHKTIDMATAEQWYRDGLLMVQRKRDGMRHHLVSGTDGSIKIYSSGKNDVTEHLDPLIRDLVLPPRTVLDVELVVTRLGTAGHWSSRPDDFLCVSGIARSLPERAHRMIEEAEGAGKRVQLMAFDLLWEDGAPMYRRPYGDRYKRLGRLINLMEQADHRTLTLMLPVLHPVTREEADLATAYELVKKYKWEGLVVWRKDQSSMVNVNGSPARINCWKMKPVGEEDVIAVGFEKGKGRNRDVVGKFKIALLKGKDPNSGHPLIHPMGKCGTGLNDQTRRDALDWKYPCVIQIEYDQRSEKGFRFPVFIRKRDDKKVADCVG